jgi:hypothetical protein
MVLATPHRAVPGPYHRIHPAIKRLVEAVRAPLDEAGAAGVAGEPATLSRHLRSGRSVPYLEEIDFGVMQGPLKVWKVRLAA